MGGYRVCYSAEERVDVKHKYTLASARAMGYSARADFYPRSRDKSVPLQWCQGEKKHISAAGKSPGQKKGGALELQNVNSRLEASGRLPMVFG